MVAVSASVVGCGVAVSTVVSSSVFSSFSDAFFWERLNMSCRQVICASFISLGSVSGFFGWFI